MGVTMEFWTAPKPFEAFPNFVMPPPQVLEVLDHGLHLRFPNVSGYNGGSLTDFFLAVSPDHAYVATSSKQGRLDRNFVTFWLTILKAYKWHLKSSFTYFRGVLLISKSR